MLAGLKILFGSLAAVAVPAAAFYGGMMFEGARADARFEKARADAADQRAEAAYDAGKEAAKRADETVAATQALADAVAKAGIRGINIQAELRKALDASDLALCRYPDDVRGLRSEVYQNAREATSATRD